MAAGGASNRLGSHCAASSSPEVDDGGEADALALQGEEHISTCSRGGLGHDWLWEWSDESLGSLVERTSL
jgi:hypothetical protein